MLAAPVALVLLAGAAHGQTDATWLSAANNTWFNAAAWDILQVPNNTGPTFNARIGPGLAGGSPNFTALLDQNATIESLTLTQLFTTLDLTTNTLTLNQDLTINQATLRATPALGGGTIDISGDLFLTQAKIIGAMVRTSPTSQVFFNTGPGAEDFICDTEVEHRGRMRYQGGGMITLDGGTIITLQAGSTLEFESAAGDISGMGAPSIVNNGTILQGVAGASTTITGVAITNAGVLEVSEGTLSTDGVSLVGGVLDGGTWRVSNGASLDLQGAAILTNSAVVELDGGGSSFAALAGLATNAAAGELRFTGGSSFTTAGSFSNDGLLEVGGATEFTVASGSSLTNFGAGGLAGGSFDIAGTLRFDGADIAVLGAELVLDGAAAQIVDQLGQSGLRNLDTIAAQGDLTLRSGATLTTAGDLTVATTGRLGIDVGSTFTVPSGSTITNFAGGTFTGGVFDVRGTLVIDADVQTLDGDFTLDGPVSTIVRPGGGDVFENLSLIDTNGALTLRNGRNLSVLGSVTVNGRLTVESGPPEAPSVFIVPLDVVQNSGAVELREGGIVRVGAGGPGAYRLGGGALRGVGTIEGNLIQTGGAVEPGIGPGTLAIDGNWSVASPAAVVIELAGVGPGMADLVDVSGSVALGTFAQPLAGMLSIALINGYVPSPAGDTFEIIRGSQRLGQFAQTSGPMVGGNVAYEVFYTPTSVWVTVYAVPTPAGLGLLLSAPLLGWRRRR